MNILFLAASVALSWAPVQGAQYYNVCMNTKSMKDGTAPNRIYKTTESKYLVPSLTAGTKYYFYIRTYCPYGTLLGNSNEIVHTAK